MSSTHGPAHTCSSTWLYALLSYKRGLSPGTRGSGVGKGSRRRLETQPQKQKLGLPQKPSSSPRSAKHRPPSLRAGAAPATEALTSVGSARVLGLSDTPPSAPRDLPSPCSCPRALQTDQQTQGRRLSREQADFSWAGGGVGAGPGSARRHRAVGEGAPCFSQGQSPLPPGLSQASLLGAAEGPGPSTAPPRSRSRPGVGLGKGGAVGQARGAREALDMPGSLSAPKRTDAQSRKGCSGTQPSLPGGPRAHPKAPPERGFLTTLPPPSTHSPVSGSLRKGAEWRVQPQPRHAAVPAHTPTPTTSTQTLAPAPPGPSRVWALVSSC